MKNIIVPLVLVVLIIGSAGAYYALYMQKPAAVTPIALTPTVTQSVEKKVDESLMSLSDLIMKGGNQKCSYTVQDAEAGATSGTTYIAPRKVRTDFTFTAKDGKKNDGSMIYDGTTLYTWSSAQKEGIKMTLEKTFEETIADATNMQGDFSEVNKKMQYDCSAWNGDMTMFAPPKTVTFVDYSALMKNVMVSLPPVDKTQNPATNCALCDSVPEETRAACKTALKCE